MTTEQNTLPAVAQNIFISCKKCESDRYHKVLAHTSETSAKVQCEVCGSKKTYKLPKPKIAKPPSKARKSKVIKNDSPGWETLKSEIGVGNIQNYKMSISFKNQSAIQHPSFGVGFIVQSTPQKIEVVFEDGVRQLVHNRQS